MDSVLDLESKLAAGKLRPGIREMLSYWQGLRNGAPVPARANIDPLAIQPFLPNAAILEKTATGNVKFRLAGNGLHRIMGVEPRGIPIRSLFDVTARAQAQDLLDAVFSGPQTLVLTVLAEREGTVPITGQMLVLPLTDMMGEVTRALVMFVADATQDKGPFRFRIRHAHLSPIGDVRMAALTKVQEQKPDMRPVRVRVHRGKRAHLRVIEGGLS